MRPIRTSRGKAVVGDVTESADSVPPVNYRKWAGFLAAWVDFNCGKGTSDRAWESYLGGGPDAERPTWVPAHIDGSDDA
jgi:hypothetical protein